MHIKIKKHFKNEKGKRYVDRTLGLAKLIVRGEAFALRAAGDIKYGLSRICLFSYSLGSASSLIRLLALYLIARGETEKGFSLTSAAADLAPRLLASMYLPLSLSRKGFQNSQEPINLRTSIVPRQQFLQEKKTLVRRLGTFSCEASRSVGFAKILIRSEALYRAITIVKVHTEFIVRKDEHTLFGLTSLVVAECSPNDYKQIIDFCVKDDLN
ncbi:hypothetical protein GQX74_006384 [Glossina fuscipes]|nr:hypothetical protein GQX74_006384 [Glossina fuscipes]